MTALLHAASVGRRDANKCPLIEQDYRWAIRMGFFTDSEKAWRDWVDGYELGEHIGRRVARRRKRAID